MKRIRQSLGGISIAVMMAAPSAHADTAMREFIMSCTYGVLAGTLVGTALLAFTAQPSENLNKVARGASIGLYSGILLGLYVVYGVSDQPEDPDMLNGPSGHWRARSTGQRWALVPTFESGRFSGGGMVGEVLSF